VNTKNVTITDVAKEAGLSIATVSRVINHARNVDPESEKTIRKAMQKLGYVPAVKKQKFSVMALIVPSLENHFFLRSLRV
jgi:Transcriptional regulators